MAFGGFRRFFIQWGFVFSHDARMRFSPYERTPISLRPPVQFQLNSRVAIFQRALLFLLVFLDDLFLSSEAGSCFLQSTDFPLWRWRLDWGSVSKVGLVEVWLSSCAVCPPKQQALFSLSWLLFSLPPFSCGSMAVAAFLECDLCLWAA